MADGDVRGYTVSQLEDDNAQNPGLAEWTRAFSDQERLVEAGRARWRIPASPVGPAGPPA